jgi:hypothetical protein
MSSSQTLRLLNDAMNLNREKLLKGILLAETAAPATPPAGTVVIYLDAADGDLKSKNDAGEVVVIANHT